MGNRGVDGTPRTTGGDRDRACCSDERMPAPSRMANPRRSAMMYSDASNSVCDVCTLSVSTRLRYRCATSGARGEGPLATQSMIRFVAWERSWTAPCSLLAQCTRDLDACTMRTAFVSARMVLSMPAAPGPGGVPLGGMSAAAGTAAPLGGAPAACMAERTAMPLGGAAERSLWRRGGA